jgi:hypothetical protein
MRTAQRPKVHPTRITVKHNGTPLDGATVILSAADAQHGAFGKTNSKGVCRMTTFKSEDGAVPGVHRVAVKKTEIVTVPDPTEYDPQGVKVMEERRLIPQRYERFEVSGLQVTVTEDGDNEFELDLTD